MISQKCYIFGALRPKELVYKPGKDDLVIAADRGVEVLSGLGIVPDVIIGDFDSLGYTPSGKNVQVLPVVKDDTDVGYAIKYALLEGYTDFVIYGGIGGLIDHTYANIQLAAYVSKHGGRAIFVGDDYYVTAITDNSIHLKGKSERVSVFAADTKVSGVTVKGLKYELENAELKSSFPLGVSNEFIGKGANISVKSGTLIIMTQTKI